MFGIGTIEMLVIGAVLWMVLRGKFTAATFVWAGIGLLVLLVCVSMATLAWNTAAFRTIVRDGGAEIHSQHVSPVTWSIALGPMLIVIVAFVVLLAVIAHRGLGHAFAGSHGHIWPAFLVVPIVGFLMLGGIRYQTASHFNAAPPYSPPPPVIEQQRQWAATQVEQAKAYQKQLGEQAKQLAANVEAAVKNTTISQHINRTDIHQLMDEFDAPRIVLQVPLTPSTAPAAFIMAAAASASKEAAEASAKKEAVAKKDPPKIKLKSTADSDKHTAAVELKVESSPDTKEEADATKPDEPDDASIGTEAEAPQPPVPPVPPVAPVPVPQVPTVQSETKPKPPIVEHEPRVVKSGTTPPAWINDPPKRTGEVRREVIATEDYESAEECYAAADIYLMIRTYERLQQIRGVPAGVARLPSITFHPDEISADGRMIAMGNPPANWTDPRFAQLSQMGIGAEFLRREIVAKDPDSSESREYLETVTRSVGPMKKLYMQVEFTPAIDRELMRFAEAYSRQERFAAVGFGAGSILTLLTMVWGLLKIDTATKGYYTKRLFLGVPLAIIAGVVAVIAWISFNL